VHGLRTGIEDSGEVDRRGNVMKRKPRDDGEDECEETDEKEAFNFRVFSGVALSTEWQPMFISPALRLFIDNMDIQGFSFPEMIAPLILQSLFRSLTRDTGKAVSIIYLAMSKSDARGGESFV